VKALSGSRRHRVDVDSARNNRDSNSSPSQSDHCLLQPQSSRLGVVQDLVAYAMEKERAKISPWDAGCRVGTSH
jgi:hypothetical protein